MSPAQGQQYGQKQNVDGGVDGQIPAFLVRVLAHDVLVRNKRGHRGDERTHAAQIGANRSRSRHWSQKPESRIVVGTLLIDLAGADRHLQRMAADQRARQFVEFGHALHVADEDEEHAEGERQSPIHVFEYAPIGEQEHDDHDHAHHPPGESRRRRPVGRR